MLRNNFGTIRGCERAVDVFFHFDALDEGNISERSPAVFPFSVHLCYLVNFVKLHLNLGGLEQS